MALLERVATLVRANLNDLIDKAEDPEKMLKQVILDMENQLLQVKTQVAIAMADQHVLENKRKETAEKAAVWMRKAEMAVSKGQEDLARAAVERSLASQQMAAGFEQQVGDQKVEVENLKSALAKLEQKLEEARSRGELLVAQHRRARALRRATAAKSAVTAGANSNTFDRMKHKVVREEAVSRASAVLEGDSVEDRFAVLEKQDEVERILAEIKARQGLGS